MYRVDWIDSAVFVMEFMLKVMLLDRLFAFIFTFTKITSLKSQRIFSLIDFVW